MLRGQVVLDIQGVASVPDGRYVADVWADVVTMDYAPHASLVLFERDYLAMVRDGSIKCVSGPLPIRPVAGAV